MGCCPLKIYPSDISLPQYGHFIAITPFLNPSCLTELYVYKERKSSRIRERWCDFAVVYAADGTRYISAPRGGAEIKESIPSSRNRATVQGTIGFDCLSSADNRRKADPDGELCICAADGTRYISAPPWGQKSRSRFRPAGIEQPSTGRLHLIVRIPSAKQNRENEMYFFL